MAVVGPLWMLVLFGGKGLMDEAVAYDEVCRRIAYRNYEDSGQTEPPQPTGKVTMIGLLFAPPDALLAKAEVLPRLEYFHDRSGSHIDFFCAGYTRGDKGVEDYKEAGLPGWVYSNRKFNQFREDIIKRSRWKYSGETDLILLNAEYSPSARAVNLDFTTAILCKLDVMKKDEAITSVASFFEDIFNYAEHADATDPTWGFSDERGLATGGSAFKRFILSLLPKDIGKDVTRATHFSVVDISVPAMV
jgi:hypothetical protein